MRIVKSENIILNESELNIWDRYDQLLESILKDSNDSKIIELIQDIQGFMFDLADYIVVEES